MLSQLWSRFAGKDLPNPHNIDLKAYNSSRSQEDATAICQAPFKSMRFEQLGVVKTCCYSQFFLLGRFPSSSLNDIWFGEQTQSFRKAMQQNDLSRGCDLCLAQIKNGEYNNAKPKQYDNLGETTLGYPVVLDFSLHNTCNLECVMCQGMLSSSIRKNRDKLPALKNSYEGENFMQQLDVYLQHARQFVFAGGEPFLIDTYYKIWERIAQLNIKVSIDIVTNGTVLSPKVKRVLELLKPNISVSIESLQAERYMEIRKNGTLAETMANIQFFYETCKVNGSAFTMSVCPLQLNWSEIPDIIAYCNSLDIKLYIHTVNSPVSLALWCLPEEKLLKIKETYSKVTLPTATTSQLHNAKAFADLLKQVEGWYDKAKAKQGVLAQDGETYIDAVEFLERLQQKFNNSGYENEVVRVQEIVEGVSGRNLRIPVRAAQEIISADADALAGSIQGKATQTLIEDIERLHYSH